MKLYVPQRYFNTASPKTISAIALRFKLEGIFFIFLFFVFCLRESFNLCLLIYTNLFLV